MNLNLYTIKTKYWRLLGISKDIWHTYKPIFETNSSIENTILIAGTARSGTTWLGSVLAGLLNARPIFEPFLLTRNKQFFFSINKRCLLTEKNKKNLLMNYSLYISPNTNEKKVRLQIEVILKGKIRSSWTDREAVIGKIYRKRIIKEVRANLFLTFLATTWPQIKIIWLIRNPFNVIKSQLYLTVKHKWGFDLDINILLKEDKLIHDWLYPFIDEIKKADNLFERLTHRWCIENLIPFKQNILNHQNVLLVYYDKLLSSQEEWQKIFNFLKINVNYDKFYKKYFSRPSMTYVKKAKKQVNQVLATNNYTVDNILKILELYGIKNFISKDVIYV